MSIEQVSKARAVGDQPHSFIEVGQPRSQEALTVLGGSREASVDLIAQHLAGVQVADRDQRPSRERNQNAHEQRQLEHDRAPGNRGGLCDMYHRAGVYKLIHDK